MSDDFATHARGLMSPAESAFAITPHDTNELTKHTRAIWVGGAGNLTVQLSRDDATVVITGVPAGTLLPIRAKLVHTDTTATSLVGLL